MTDKQVAGQGSGVKYDAKQVVQRTDDISIVEYTLGVGQRHPWHRHSQVSDRFYCLSGLVGVDVREPAQQYRLRPGESCEVPAGLVHFASNAGAEPCRYLLIQALGKYDYIRVE